MLSANFYSIFHFPSIKGLGFRVVLSTVGLIPNPPDVALSPYIYA